MVKKEKISNFTKSFGSLGEWGLLEHKKNLNNGYEVEKLLHEESTIPKLNGPYSIDFFKNLSDGKYLLYKKAFKKSGVIKVKVEPDVILLFKEKNNISFTLIELKSSNAFDTAKSDGQKNKLVLCCKDIKNSGFNSNYYFCSVASEEKSDYSAPIRQLFTDDTLLTFKELCSILNIDFYKVKDLFNDKLFNIKRNRQELIENLSLECKKDTFKLLLSNMPIESLKDIFMESQMNIYFCKD